MRNQLKKIKSISSYTRKIGRRNHAELRLRERFGLDFLKIKNIIRNNGFAVLFEKNNGGDKVCHISYMGKDIYFIAYKDEIKTFMKADMIAQYYPEIFISNE